MIRLTGVTLRRGVKEVLLDASVPLPPTDPPEVLLLFACPMPASGEEVR